MALTIDYNRQFDTGICNPRRRIPNLQRAPPAPSLFHNLPPNFCFFNIYMYRTRPDSDLATFVYNFNLGAPVLLWLITGAFWNLVALIGSKMSFAFCVVTVLPSNGS